MPGFHVLVPPGGLPIREKLARFLVEAGFQIEGWRGLPGVGYVVARKRLGPLA